MTTPQALYLLRPASVSTPVLALQIGLPVYENVSTVYVTFNNLVLLLFVLLTLHLGEVSSLPLHLPWLQGSPGPNPTFLAMLGTRPNLRQQRQQRRNPIQAGPRDSLALQVHMSVLSSLSSFGLLSESPGLAQPGLKATLTAAVSVSWFHLLF